MIERAPLLVERQSTHGSFVENARISQQIKAVMHSSSEWKRLLPPKREALDMIALKISRILSSDVAYKDHWDDISGYALLGSEACD